MYIYIYIRRPQRGATACGVLGSFSEGEGGGGVPRIPPNTPVTGIWFPRSSGASKIANVSHFCHPATPKRETYHIFGPQFANISYFCHPAMPKRETYRIFGTQFANVSHFWHPATQSARYSEFTTN